METWHKDGNPDIENVHELPPDLLAKREVRYLDIANDPIDEKDYSEALDPRLFKSEKTNRGPLLPDWRKTSSPHMCCYKLITIKFQVFGVQGRAENLIASVNFSNNLLK